MAEIEHSGTALIQAVSSEECFSIDLGIWAAFTPIAACAAVPRTGFEPVTFAV